jgi:hypothetical protein
MSATDWQAPRPAWVAQGQLVTTDYGGFGIPDGHSAHIAAAYCTVSGWFVQLDPPHPRGGVEFPLRWCKPVFGEGQDAELLSEIFDVEPIGFVPSMDTEGGGHD